MTFAESFPRHETLPLAGYPVAAIRSEALKQALIDDLEAGRNRKLFFVNTNFVNQCSHLRLRMCEPDVVLVNDGVGMDIGSYLVHRRRYPDNLNGTDFVPALLKTMVDYFQGPSASRPVPSVFLLGAAPGVAVRAAEVLREQGVPVAGTLDGYSESANNEDVVAQINNSGADIVLVATGNPKQESWILENAPRLKATLYIGVGALLDFLAGEKPRAPELVRRLRMEWFYRLSLEPRRLARRYTLDIGRFLVRCMKVGRATGTEYSLD